MLIQELAADIHRNAVEHGWWDGERNLYEVLALIHSEWSEALEEARAGRPMWWHNCSEGDGVINNPCSPKNNPYCGHNGETDGCPWLGDKPEGVAVELMDGVIRILDFLGYVEADLVDPETGAKAEIETMKEIDDDALPEDLSTVIAFLHRMTSDAMPEEDQGEVDFSALLSAMNLAMSYVAAQGLDPLWLLLKKHEYNKSRPYKHGKKF